VPTNGAGKREEKRMFESDYLEVCEGIFTDKIKEVWVLMRTSSVLMGKKPG